MSAIVFTVLGLLIAVVAAVKGLESPGIKFDEHGVWVQWHFAMRLLEWGEIERVNALAEGNMRTLEIRLKRGYGVRVLQRVIGSDPYWVAEIISHFFSTPQHRAVLHDPLRALGLAVVIDPDQSRV